MCKNVDIKGDSAKVKVIIDDVIEILKSANLTIQQLEQLTEVVDGYRGYIFKANLKEGDTNEPLPSRIIVLESDKREPFHSRTISADHANSHVPQPIHCDKNGLFHFNCNHANKN